MKKYSKTMSLYVTVIEKCLTFKKKKKTVYLILKILYHSVINNEKGKKNIKN